LYNSEDIFGFKKEILNYQIYNKKKTEFKNALKKSIF